MIDRPLVEQKLKLIRADLEELAREKPKDFDALLDDSRARHVVEHLLEHIVNRAIDLNGHLLVESGHPPPDTYEDSFLQLAELRILSREFAAQIAKSAGLRNRLIHDYDGVNYEVLYEAIGEALREYPEYLNRVTAFLAQTK